MVSRISQDRPSSPQEATRKAVADLLKEARSQLFSLCEDTLDNAYDRLQTPGLTEHELGYLRGSRAEAKAISRAMADVFRELLAKAEEPA